MGVSFIIDIYIWGNSKTESISFVIVSQLKGQDLKLDLPLSEAQDLTHCWRNFYPGNNFFPNA